MQTTSAAKKCYALQIRHLSRRTKVYGRNRSEKCFRGEFEIFGIITIRIPKKQSRLGTIRCNSRESTFRISLVYYYFFYEDAVYSSLRPSNYWYVIEPYDNKMMDIDLREITSK